MDVLDGIDTLPWSTWHHAYGPADDVPACLRALCSRNKERQQDAQWELYGNLWHQGTIYEATGHAIPWLVALLEHPNVDRAWLLTYLGHLAQGRSYNAQHAELEFIDSKTPEYQAQMAKEVGWVRDCVAAIERGGTRLAACLQDDDPRVRATALYALSNVPRLLEDFRDAIVACSRDLSAMVRGSAVLALSYSDTPEPCRVAAERALMDLSPGVRWAGAYALAFLPGTSGQAIQTLLGALNDGERVAEVLAESPFVEEGIDSMSAIALARMDAHPATEVLDTLIAQLPRVEPIQSLTLVSTLLHLVFGPHPVSSFVGLTALEKRCLHAIADADNVWVFDANLWPILEHWGLPTERGRLASVTESSPSDPPH